MPTSGASSRHSTSSADSRGHPTPPARAMRRVPRCPAATACTLVRACSRVSSTRRASFRNTCPAGVRRTPRGVHSSSVTSKSASSWRIVRDRGDCSTCSRRAARPKCNSSATAMKQRRWRKFMYFDEKMESIPLTVGNRMNVRWRGLSSFSPGYILGMPAIPHPRTAATVAALTRARGRRLSIGPGRQLREQNRSRIDTHLSGVRSRQNRHDVGGGVPVVLRVWVLPRRIWTTAG